MSNHQKRLSVPKSWPVERKTETFTVKAEGGPHGEEGVPLIIILRDVLGYVDSRKEARYALEQDSVLVNGDPINDEQLPVGMFDILAFREREEFYRVFPDEGGRLSLTPIDEDAAGSKLGKVVNKTQIAGGDTQLTLHDGGNIVVEDADAYDGNDSLVVSSDNEIVAHFSYEEGALVTAVRGGHAGDIGTITDVSVTMGSASNTVTVERDDGSTFETVEEYVVVIDENFTEDSDDESEPSSGDSPETDDGDAEGSDASDDEEVSDDE